MIPLVIIYLTLTEQLIEHIATHGSLEFCTTKVFATGEDVAAKGLHIKKQ